MFFAMARFLIYCLGVLWLRKKSTVARTHSDTTHTSLDHFKYTIILSSIEQLAEKSELDWHFGFKPFWCVSTCWWHKDEGGTAENGITCTIQHGRCLAVAKNNLYFVNIMKNILDCIHINESLLHIIPQMLMSAAVTHVLITEYVWMVLGNSPVCAQMAMEDYTVKQVSLLII